jgi:geranylgeranyl diphosphate synthase, type II
MKSFEELTKDFLQNFNTRHFPSKPASLYEPAEYFLGLGGKRIRPVMCLMGNELFDQLNPDAWHVATAIELFHNFTLIHDDIMDKAPLRRNMQTVHEKFGEPAALLSGDVMLVTAYQYINKINSSYLHKIINIFNKTAREVCEGQQLDMDFEKVEQISFREYLQMIELKTSVLIGSSLQMGSILGGAGDGNQRHLYEFGKNLGLAFQVQDDYLDAFGDPAKFGKQMGGDIVANKKTFLFIRAMEMATEQQRAELKALMRTNSADKIAKVLRIFRECGVDEWANKLKEKFVNAALQHLDDIAVLSVRKVPLQQLAGYFMNRDF